MPFFEVQLDREAGGLYCEDEDRACVCVCVTAAGSGGGGRP